MAAVAAPPPGVSPSKNAYLPRDQTDPDAILDYGKILHFFVNPDTSSIHTRQLALIKKICRHNFDGYRVEALPCIAQLLDLAHERAVNNNHPEFEEALCVLIDLAAKPYVRLKANHELYEEGTQALEALVSALGRLLSSPVACVKLSAVAALKQLTEGRDHLRKNDPHQLHVIGGVVREDLRPMPKEYNNAMLLRCGIIEAAATELAKDGAEYAEALLQEAAEAASRAEAIATLRSTMSRQKGRGQQDEEEEEGEEGEGGEGAGKWTLGEEESSYQAPLPPEEETEGEGDYEDSEAEGYDAFWEEDDIVLLPGEEEGERRRRQEQRRSVLKKHMVYSLLALLREFTAHPANTAPLVRADVVNTIIEIVAVVPRIQEPIISVSMDILWNLLDSSAEALKSAPLAESRAKLVSKWRENNAIYRMGSERALWVLKDLVQRLLDGGYRSRDKELRNAVIIIMSFITRNPHVHPAFLSTGLLDFLLAYATVAELAGQPQQPDNHNHQCLLQATADPHNYATTGALDLELKRLLWGLLSNLLLVGAQSAPDNIIQILDSPLMEVLLMYIHRLPNDALPETPPATMVDRLPEAHLPETQLQALATLINLVPLAPQQFLALNGVTLVLRLLRSEPATNPQPERVHRGMLLVQATASLPGLKEEYGRQGAVQLALNYFLAPQTPEPLRLISLRILALACKGYVGNQTVFRREGGPQALIEAMNQYNRQRSQVLKNLQKDPLAKKASSSLRRVGMRSSPGGSQDDQSHALPICLIGTVWDAIVGNSKSESSFLDRGGMEAVLDMLEYCPTIMKNQVLGLLSDLLNHPASLAYAEAWRSDTTLAAAPQLLLMLWAQEEDRLQVSRPDGVIVNLPQPLQQHVAPRPSSLAFSHLDDALSAAGHSQLQDLRPRLAVTLHQLGARGAWKEKINAKESATFAVAQNYETFRKGEVWRQVDSNLRSNRGIKPIAADALLMKDFLDDSFRTAERVQAHQSSLHQLAEKEELKEEEKVYKGILLQRDQEIHQLRLKRKGMAGRFKKRNLEADNKASSSEATTTTTTDSSSNNTTASDPTERMTTAGDGRDDHTELPSSHGGGGKESVVTTVVGGKGGGHQEEEAAAITSLEGAGSGSSEGEEGGAGEAVVMEVDPESIMSDESQSGLFGGGPLSAAAE